MKCPECENIVPDGSKFCSHCGHKFEQENTIKCPNPECGHLIPADSKFCPDCGSKTEGKQNDASITINVNGIDFNMIRVDGGTFIMGEGEKSHQISLGSYYIGETPVTQKLWMAVMESNPSHYKGGENPVECVSWNDCQEFIKKLNQKTGQQFRLPTDEEWEFSAKGGCKSRHTQFSGSNKLDEVAWFKENSGGTTHPVKNKKPNELGLYDMNGNVWEWCFDVSELLDIFRVCRGGSYCHDAKCCILTYQGELNLDSRGYNVGLRLALSE